MEGIRDKVAIIGMGCTKFGENWGKSVEDLMIDAAYEAYEDAGVGPKDIQAAWFGNIWAGETGQILAAPLKLRYIPVTHVENACATGSEALRGACYAVASGACDIALALGVEKLKDTGFTGLPQTRPIATWSYRITVETPVSVFAMMANGYFAKYGLSREEGRKLLAQIAVKNHYNGTLSPKAHFQRKITLEDVLNAPMVADPLGLYDCCGVSDGGAAAIVTRADWAKKFRADPIYIKSQQICQGPREGWINPAVYDFAHVEETYQGGLAAYAEAGIKNPREEISIAEVHDCFTITELTIMEDLQFSPRGRVREDVEAGTFNLNGKLPVNTDGGLKCFGHPIGATGLRMMYEVYKQLQGKAGPRQVKNPSRVLKKG
jgi:acetyl-CoA C-acetyltransferase